MKRQATILTPENHLSSRLTSLEFDLLQHFERISSQFWLPPHELRSELIRVDPRLEELDLVVTGEDKTITAYIRDEKAVLVLMPFLDIAQNALLCELFEPNSLPKTHSVIIPRDPLLDDRFDLPRILLINPCVLNTHPIPRLSLGVGMVAAYLRKLQKGDVRIIDMQVGTTLSEIESYASDWLPEIIGVSISYGQKHAVESILDRLWEQKRGWTHTPLIVLGNIIPASFPDEFLDRYPGIMVASGEGELTAARTRGLCQRTSRTFSGSRARLSGREGMYALDRSCHGTDE